MAISSEQLDDVRRRLDAVQVVGQYVQLKKKGQRWVGLCPFHNEKTPSFSVAPDKGLYYCFGCHAGGDVFSFVMKQEGLDFSGAARKLAVLAGVELEPEDPRLQAQRRAQEEIEQVNAYALAFFEHALWAADGRAARAYLGERQLPQEVARAWRLGFGGRPGELQKYLAAKNIRPELVAKTGLLSEDGRHGLFDGRLVFPIIQSPELVVGFGGRRLGDDGPKYVNSRESALFEKRRLLFGWQRAEGVVRKSRRVVIVEGYLDVIACHRAGIDEAVAALGTAFTEEHAKTVCRLAKEAYLLFDADAAGQKASFEATERLVAAKLKTVVVPLPAGDDPDSLLRRSGAPALAAALAQAKPALEHFIAQAFARDGMAIEDKAEAARALAPILIALGSGLERDLYLARLAERVGVTAEQLAHDIFRAPPKKASRPRQAAASAVSQASGASPPSSTPAAPPAPTRQELEWLRQLLLYPELRPRFGELAEYATDPLRLLLDDLAHPERELEATLATHLKNAKVVHWLLPREPLVELSPEDVEAAMQRSFTDVLSRMKAQLLSGDAAQLLTAIKDAEARGEDPTELLHRQSSLTRTRRQLRRPRSNG